MANIGLLAFSPGGFRLSDCIGTAFNNLGDIIPEAAANLQGDGSAATVFDGIME